MANNILQVSEIEISYNPLVKPSEMITIGCSADAEKIFRDIWKNLTYKESFYALYMNRANKVLGYQLISMGGLAGTAVDVRCIFQAALKACASAILIAHNHPSGSNVPSDADIKITRKIRDAGKLLDINLLDHLILLPEGYTSLADEGVL